MTLFTRSPPSITKAKKKFINSSPAHILAHILPTLMDHILLPTFFQLLWTVFYGPLSSFVQLPNSNPNRGIGFSDISRDREPRVYLIPTYSCQETVQLEATIRAWRLSSQILVSLCLLYLILHAWYLFDKMSEWVMYCCVFYHWVINKFVWDRENNGRRTTTVSIFFKS